MRVFPVAALILALTSNVNAAFSTGNLLNNPGAEVGSIAGWTPGGSATPGVDSGTFNPGINPHSGSFDFLGVTSAMDSLTQVVGLVGNQGITAPLIDSGGLLASISFWEQGLNQGTPSDSASVSLSFLNGSGSSLGSITTPIIDSHNLTWENFSEFYAIPVNTRSISYTMNFIRNVGSDNDSYVDDNSLIVVQPTAAVPEPTGLALLGIGLTGVAAYLSNRKTFQGSAEGTA